ncbi:MAG: T9SS type A sorting domain-containing protein [Bacteroidota bacterium]
MRAVPLVGVLVLVAGLATTSSQVQPSGVLLHDSGGDSFVTGIALSNATGAAPHTIGLTPRMRNEQGIYRDSLFRSPLQGRWSSDASMSLTGRVVFEANWLHPFPSNARTFLFAQDRDGTNRVQLTDSTAATRGQTPLSLVRDDEPAISPDGHTVVFVSTRFREDESTQDVNVFTVPASGGALRQLTTAEMATVPNGQTVTCRGFERVEWSPDGSRIAFIGQRVARDANGTPTPSGCVASFGTMRPDGTDVRILRRGGFANESPYNPSGRVLSWTAGGLLYYDNRTLRFEWVRPDGTEIRTLPFTGTLDGFTVSLGNEWALSPDGQYLATTEATGTLLIASTDGTVVDQIDTFAGGQRFIDWIDAPDTPEPVRIEMETDPDLLWGGAQVSVLPTLYDAAGRVIVVGARGWGGPLGTAVRSASLNRITGRITGGVSNDLDREVCAENGGLTTCARFNNVHTPIVTVEATDAEAAEAGRDPARIAVQRYGNPTVDVDPQLTFSGQAQLFRDYTTTEAGPLLRLGAGDTLRTEEIVVIPVDDGLAEPTESVLLRVQCPQGSGCALGSVVTQARVDIVSNGAGSGVGIASSRPDTGQAGRLVTLTVSGQGFEPGASVQLVGPASVEATAVFVQDSGTQLYAQFNLETAPLGTYGLTVASGGGSATLPGALRVIADGEAEPWASALPQFHVGSFPSRQRVVYGNRGDADAYMVPLFISVGAEAEVEMRSEIVLPPGMNPELEAALQPYLRTDSLFTLVEQCIPPPGAIGALRPLASSAADCEDRVSMRLAAFVIPVIPAGGSGTLDFSITVEGSTAPVPIGVAIGPVGLLEAAVLKAGSPECAAPETADRSTGGDVPTPDQISAACWGCAISAGALALDLVPGSGCVRAGLDLVAGIGSNMAGFSLSDGGGASLALAWNGSLASVLGAVAQCAGSVAVPATRLAEAAQESLEFIASLMGGGVGGAGLLVGCADCVDKVFWGIYYSFWSRSVDPNIKLGPPGVGEDGYVQSLPSVPYQVLFENLPDATASAREVTIVDTLDTSVFDLSTFRLGPIAIPDTTVTPPPGLRAWTTYVDRRPEQPSLLRFDAHLDAETGVARWVISDLDPVTFGYREDAGAGFLPAEAEGFVSFTVDPLPDLPNGTALVNAASIRFDREEWIDTPPWTNTLDFGAPVSRATGVEADLAASDTSYVVTITASDDGSGVQRTALYVSENDGPFLLWDLTNESEVRFEARPDTEYGFFALAVDWAGNSEGLKTQAEATLGSPVDGEAGPRLPEVVELTPPYPNPTRAGAMVQFGLPQVAHADVRVFDARGREVARLVDEERAPGWHRLPWQPDALAPGIYVIRLLADGETRVWHLTVVR